MKASNLLTDGTRRLKEAGISEPELNCQWLLAHVTGKERLSLLADPEIEVQSAAVEELERLLARKAAGEPLAYILGYQPFHGLKLKVDARVLVPRPETEELVDLVLDFAKGNLIGPVKILDFGAGSGAIGLALAAAMPYAMVSAAEKSREALACAEENARALGLAGRMEFIEASDLLSAGGPYDVIVSNPPYIPTEVIEGLDKEVLCEPRLALDGGADGLDIIRMLTGQAPAALKAGGAMFLEMGEKQGRAALDMLKPDMWSWKRLSSDLNGKERFVCAVRGNAARQSAAGMAENEEDRLRRYKRNRWTIS